MIEGEVKPPSKDKDGQEGNKGGAKKLPKHDNKNAMAKHKQSAAKAQGSKKAEQAPLATQQQDQADAMQVDKQEPEQEPEEEAEEERGWTIGDASASVRGLSVGRSRGAEEDYDLGRVFRSVRGRGGGRLGSRGGTGRGRGR